MAWKTQFEYIKIFDETLLNDELDDYEKLCVAILNLCINT